MFTSLQIAKGRVELGLIANILSGHFCLTFCPLWESLGGDYSCSLREEVILHPCLKDWVTLCMGSILWQSPELICCFKDYLLWKTLISHCSLCCSASPFCLYFYCWHFVFFLLLPALADLITFVVLLFFFPSCPPPQFCFLPMIYYSFQNNRKERWED